MVAFGKLNLIANESQFGRRVITRVFAKKNNGLKDGLGVKNDASIRELQGA
jgi:hypothetical protein